MSFRTLISLNPTCSILLGVPEMIQLQSQEQESHVQSLGDEIESLARQLEDAKWEKEEVRRKFGEEMRALNEGMAGMQVSRRA